jgi:hypothetical protein
VLASEPPERFFAYGRPMLAPADGVVVAAHDGEVDHAARRSQLALVPYALGQAARLRRGVPGVAGNHLRRDPAVARGLPMVFRQFRESPSRGAPFAAREVGVPAEGAVVEPARPR